MNKAVKELVYPQGAPAPGSLPPPEPRSVDLMMAAHNRRDFTRESLDALRASTDWGLVRLLTLYDVASTDGAGDVMAEFVDGFKDAEARLVRIPERRHIVSVQTWHATEARAPFVAKVDNDTMMPPRWLAESLAVFRTHPGLHALGLEAFARRGGASPRSFMPAQFVSGLAVWRRSTFDRGVPKAFGEHYGLEEWQIENPWIMRGWIEPAIDVFLLDRIPFEPWSGLTRRYVEAGWQREWPKYPPSWGLWKWRWSDKP